MSEQLVSKHWFLMLISSIILIVFGIYALFSPAEVFVTVILFIAFGFIISGILEIIHSFKDKNHRFHNFIMGLVTLIMGMILLVHPAITGVVLPYIVGFILLFRFISYAGFAVHLHKKGEKYFSTAIFAILGIILSVLLIFYPVLALVAVTVWIGLALIFNGITGVIISLKIKKLNSINS